MAQVTLSIAGRSHVVACRDGEEAQLLVLGERLERHAPAALRAAGSASGDRALLLIALMLADELADRERASAGGLSPALLDGIAARLESVAAALEEGVGDA